MFTLTAPFAGFVLETKSVESVMVWSLANSAGDAETSAGSPAGAATPT